MHMDLRGIKELIAQRRYHYSNKVRQAIEEGDFSLADIEHCILSATEIKKKERDERRVWESHVHVTRAGVGLRIGHNVAYSERQDSTTAPSPTSRNTGFTNKNQSRKVVRSMWIVALVTKPRGFAEAPESARYARKVVKAAHGRCCRRTAAGRVCGARVSRLRSSKASTET